MGKREREKIDQAVRALREISPQRQSGVLVIEDDPDLQWRLARMLTVQGSRVVGTSTGDGALALIAQWPVDLVLVDQDLPGMSGLEVARRIRQSHPGIQVVLMTGDDSEELKSAARLAGAAACLVKPFRVEALWDLLVALAMAEDPLPLAEPAE